MVAVGPRRWLGALIVGAVETQLTELVAPPERGRVYKQDARVGVSDSAPDGRARLDAIARWLQEAAFGDVVDAGLQDAGSWVVRRCRIRVERFPGFWEPLTVATFCSALGSLWAERRTTVAGAQGGRVEAVALWVHLDSHTGRPRPLGDEVEALYGPSTGGRRIKARLRHPLPPSPAGSAPWTFRAADLDPFGHVNNAVYWEVVEEELRGRTPTSFDAEVEHRAPADAGPAEVVAVGSMRWVLAGGEVNASFALAT
jgi:acyl-ACP thioesterase